MKLLIAHDGSPHSDAMIQGLGRCGLPESGEAVVLSVADAWTAVEGDAGPALATAGTVGGDILRAALDEAEAVAARGRDAVAAMLPGWTVRGESVAGSPAWEIIREADDWHPDLVLVGATGASRLESLVFGTTTSQVLGHVRCSVRVARGAGGATGPVRIVLGCDGSESSMDAARSVAARRWPKGSAVRVVTAVDGWLLAALQGDESTEADVRGEAGTMPETVAPLLRASGLAVETVSRDGDPKKLLVQEAAAWKADCIVVGARGRTGLSRLLLGSVALATASRASCSVEIVRASG